jgi:sRNA-binding carbon storage regulator CsrA
MSTVNCGVKTATNTPSTVGVAREEIFTTYE